MADSSKTVLSGGSPSHSGQNAVVRAELVTPAPGASGGTLTENATLPITKTGGPDSMVNPPIGNLPPPDAFGRLSVVLPQGGGMPLNGAQLAEFKD
jgi:hypothetical protein